MTCGGIRGNSEGEKGKRKEILILHREEPQAQELRRKGRGGPLPASAVVISFPALRQCNLANRPVNKTVNKQVFHRLI